MIKSSYLALLFVGFFTISCATTEQVPDQVSESQENTERVNEDDLEPEWYNHSQRSYRDSTGFIGVGLAVASDSSAAYEKSLNQAGGFLNYSIDNYAEEIRNELTEGANGDQYSSRSFIISLRKAVEDLVLTEGEVEIEVEHFEKEESVHHVYTKMRISKEEAVEMLEPGINNETFIRSLRDSHSR